MENSQKTPSVIAKLMGLDKTPPRHQPQPVSRLLSQNYLQKSSSIGKRSRKDSPNSLLGSKKRANLRTNEETLLRDFGNNSLRSDFNSDNNGENGKLPKKIVVLRPNLGNVQHGSRPSFLLDSQTVFAWEVKKQLLERHKMTKVSQKIQPGFVNSVGIKSNYESVAKLPIFKGLNFSSNLNTKSVKRARRDTRINTKSSLLISNSSSPFTDAESESKNVKSFYSETVKEECPSSEQDSPIRSYEDGSMPSNCVRINGEHSDGKVEMNQHSPNSVLETPFREDNSSSSEYCESEKTDLNGLWMQLHLLKSKSESEENDNKPEKVTSSDDERSTSTDQNTIPTILSGSKEIRDFSYLEDVLNESGFQYGNMEIRFEQWHSSECMASSSVFETLENKYGKQELWHKSERKLLFDRINLGITEIVRPRVDIRVCSKPLRRKMRSMFRRDVIEEELSALLLRQEKGVDDGVSEKAVGRGLWFDPVDELDCIVKEIEIFLFDELADELVFGLGYVCQI